MAGDPLRRLPAGALPGAERPAGADRLTQPARHVTLEFDLPPEDGARLPRLPLVREGRLAAAAPARPTPTRIVWHDTPDSALAAHGCALAEARDGWSLERIWPGAAEWPPATPPPVLAHGASVAALSQELAELGAGTGLMPVAAFEGTRRVIRLAHAGEGGRLELLDGVLRSVAAEQPACLVRLTGEAPAMHGLAVALAGTLRLAVPRHSLAARGRALARGEAPPPRRLGAASVAPGSSVAEALAQLTSTLVDVTLHWMALVPGPEAELAVHQTRVAVRRLRSALSLFARAVGEGERQAGLARMRETLRDLASRLGPARDWDVFLGATGRDLAASFSDEPRVAALLAAGERRRKQEHAALRDWLGRPETRQLEVELACFAALRPWQEAPTPPSTTEGGPPPELGPGLAPEPEPAPDRLADPCRDYARRMLTRRHRRMLRDGADLAALDIAALHELRKDGKRLRYACEFFVPLFPGKAARRFGRHMEPLQEALGQLNDAAVAAGLMRQLGGGPSRGFAAGTVQGFIAGRAAGLRQRIEAAWEAFGDADPFWE